MKMFALERLASSCFLICNLSKVVVVDVLVILDCALCIEFSDPKEVK